MLAFYKFQRHEYLHMSIYRPSSVIGVHVAEDLEEPEVGAGALDEVDAAVPVPRRVQVPARVVDLLAIVQAVM